MSEDSPFGPEYHKIQTVFKRNGGKVIIPGEWTLPEFEYLADTQWYWTEKVDGTNIRLHWNGSSVIIGGRTDNAQVPTPLLAKLQPLVSDIGLWRAVFGETPATVYGEGYGAKIQNGGNYRPDQDLIVFDIRIGHWWLRREEVHGITARLGLWTVPWMYSETLTQAIERVQECRLRSCWTKVAIEGIVGVPAVDLFTRRGDRIITKLKVKDFTDLRKSRES